MMRTAPSFLDFTDNLKGGFVQGNLLTRSSNERTALDMRDTDKMAKMKKQAIANIGTQYHIDAMVYISTAVRSAATAAFSFDLCQSLVVTARAADVISTQAPVAQAEAERLHWP